MIGSPPSPSLSITILLPQGETRRWQRAVVDRLGAIAGVAVGLAPAAAAPPPAGLDLLFAFEGVLAGHRRETAAGRVDAPQGPAPAAPDLVVDLAGGAEPGPADVPVLRPSCLGLPPLEGAVAAVLAETTPVLGLDLLTAAGTRPLARWPVAIEARRNSLEAVSMVLGRLAHLVVTAVAARQRGGFDDLAGGLPTATPSAAAAGVLAAPRLLLRSLAARIAGRLTRLVRQPADWVVVWRQRAPGTRLDDPAGDATPFRRLLDDGQRFFADPFVWRMGDRTLLFVEELPYAGGRGHISLAEIDGGGAITAPRPVLEQDCHLSYPQIVAHRGRLWMIPETSGRRTVELWCADQFPEGWRLDRILLADIDLGDATVMEHGGHWWMFGTSREPWCSSWDALRIFHAPDLFGPWREHARSPARVDVTSVRPAGAAFRLTDGWRRPVQDCGVRYGAGLAVTKIVRLTPDDFDEVVERRFHTPAPLLGLHTWNTTGRRGGYGAAGDHDGTVVEVMDAFVERRAYGDERRLDLGVAAAQTKPPA